MYEPALLKSKEASRMLRVPLSTLYRLTKSGKIKGFKIGKQWRYKKEDVMRYFNAGIEFSANAIERRQYQRINCHIVCQFKICIPDTKDIESRGFIKNISAGGALVEAPEEIIRHIYIEDPMDMRFTLELNDENMLVRSEARIVRQENNNFGIKFRELKQEIKDRILDYVGE